MIDDTPDHKGPMNDDTPGHKGPMNDDTPGHKGPMNGVGGVTRAGERVFRGSLRRVLVKVFTRGLPWRC